MQTYARTRSYTYKMCFNILASSLLNNSAMQKKECTLFCFICLLTVYSFNYVCCKRGTQAHLCIFFSLSQTLYLCLGVLCCIRVRDTRVHTQIIRTFAIKARSSQTQTQRMNTVIAIYPPPLHLHRHHNWNCRLLSSV